MCNSPVRARSEYHTKMPLGCSYLPLVLKVKSFRVVSELVLKCLALIDKEGINVFFKLKGEGEEPTKADFPF